MGTTLRHAVRTAARGVTAKAGTARRSGEWFVTVRATSSHSHSRADARAIPNPPGHYLADPFPIEVGGRHYVFLENYSYRARRAIISVSEIRPDGTCSSPRPALERGYHLSYPFVFEYGGKMYMIPETGEARRIELYEATYFPCSWRLARVLLDNLPAVDTTLHFENGLIWLFTNIQEWPGDTGELSLYWARSLGGPWRRHPQNPIVTDPGSARPAGRLFRRQGTLLRPSQDCRQQYGHAIVLNEVEVLTTKDYREKPVARIEPNWMPGIEGTHTYTFDSRYQCLDAYRRVSSFKPRLRLPECGRRLRPEAGHGTRH
jgi:hypothetical protein